ncbi:membrane protein [Mesobacillus campisalis]|uniref:Membrane protein n=1 Tax=Mesobacillus campisalis TaxID=1408103 RepID=A0A0M2SYN9_9BACI|nr:NfeD family protein [Mesobacillus campisalis]KKK39293.1 membrane protein [Mesobacillus campisalis]
MHLFGMPLETIYFYALVVAGALTILYLLFGDLLGAMFEGFINPTLIFSFVTLFSAIGYLAEKLTSFHSILIAAVSAVISFILVALLNIFVLIPLSKAEESLVYRESDLRGRTGIVITAVPEDGFGEVLIDSISGRISKPAASFNKKPIANGQKVLVIDVADGVLEVGLYEEMESLI